MELEIQLYDKRGRPRKRKNKSYNMRYRQGQKLIKEAKAELAPLEKRINTNRRRIAEGKFLR